MKISMILAWCAVLCVLLTAARYPARISKNLRCSRAFHKLHIPVGLLALLLGLLHGLLAGNFPGGAIVWGTVLLTLNWGSLCFLLIVLLLGTYLLRKPMKKLWMPVHRVLTVLLLAALIVHVADVGIHVLDKAPAPAAAAPTVSVPVTVQPALSQAPEAPAPTETPVPTASPTPTAEEPSPDPSPEPAPEPTPEPTTRVEFSGAVLADGVYQGTAQGYKGPVTVEVTVAEGAVTAVTVLSHSDTPNYFNAAASIPDTVVADQSLQVDAVTGATYSSAGLLNAIEDALSGAVLEGTLQVNEAVDDLPAGGHGRH